MDELLQLLAHEHVTIFAAAMYEVIAMKPRVYTRQQWLQACRE
jgi:hypothetical protein